MPRYKLRTLLILVALGPPMLAVSWLRYDQWTHELEADRELDAIFAQVLFGNSVQPSLRPRGGVLSELQPLYSD
jgi:hypothetical protein